MITLDDDVNIKDYAAEFRDSLIENYELVYNDLNDLIINSKNNDKAKSSYRLSFDTIDKEFVFFDDPYKEKYNRYVVVMLNSKIKPLQILTHIINSIKNDPVYEASLNDTKLNHFKY